MCSGCLCAFVAARKAVLPTVLHWIVGSAFCSVPVAAACYLSLVKA